MHEYDDDDECVYVWSSKVEEDWGMRQEEISVDELDDFENRNTAGKPKAQTDLTRAVADIGSFFASCPNLCD